MTALSRNVTRASQTPAAVSPLTVALFAMPVLAAAHIYQGALVALTPAGYLTNASADASQRVIGVCEAEADNTAGASGDISAVPQRGLYYFANSGTTDAITDGDIGRSCYVVDNNTVARTSSYGARPVAGRIAGVDPAGLVIVEVGVDADTQSAGDFAVLSASDLSSSQFYAVDLANASGVAKATAISAAGQRVVGIVQNAPASGAVAIIRPVGCGRFSKMISGGSVTAGDTVGVTSAGKAKTAVKGRVDSTVSSATDPLIGSNTAGIALVTGSSDGDVIQVLLTSVGMQPTTAA